MLMVCIHYGFRCFLYHGVQYGRHIGKHQVPYMYLGHLFMDFLSTMGHRNRHFQQFCLVGFFEFFFSMFGFLRGFVRVVEGWREAFMYWVR